MKAFTPLSKHGFNFKNRIALPGLTRCRADPATGLPNDLIKEYYRQRAESASLIVTESLPVNNACNPWPGSARISSASNIPAWRQIIDAVHKEDSYIFAQLFHGGRLVHPDHLNGNLPLAPSAINIKGDTWVIKEMKPFPTPKEMTQNDIHSIIKDHVHNVKLALEAGFDGIEINGGAGLLPDQFLKPSSNTRKDKYGGSVENRSRFVLELIDEMLGVVDPKKLGLKVSFVGRAFDSFDDNPWETINYLIPQLKKRGLLYLSIAESEDFIPENNGALQIENSAKEVRKLWDGLLITNGFRPVAERLRKVEDDEADFASFGRLLISNPDLTARLKNNWPLADMKPEFAYVGGPKGYTDYPKYSPEKSA